MSAWVARATLRGGCRNRDSWLCTFRRQGFVGPLSAARHSLSIGNPGPAISVSFIIGPAFGGSTANMRSAATFETLICSTASHMVHLRRTIKEPSGCRSRSTACCVERRHSPEHVAVTAPTGSGDAATTDGGGSKPGMDICKGAELRLFFLAIVDLFCVREHVARRWAGHHRFGGRVGKGSPHVSAWYPSLPQFLRRGPISGPERSLDL